MPAIRKARDRQCNGEQNIAIFPAFLYRTIFGRCHSGKPRTVLYVFAPAVIAGRPPLHGNFPRTNSHRYSWTASLATTRVFCAGWLHDLDRPSDLLSRQNELSGQSGRRMVDSRCYRADIDRLDGCRQFHYWFGLQMASFAVHFPLGTVLVAFPAGKQKDSS